MFEKIRQSRQAKAQQRAVLQKKADSAQQAKVRNIYNKDLADAADFQKGMDAAEKPWKKPTSDVGPYARGTYAAGYRVGLRHVRNSDQFK